MTAPVAFCLTRPFTPAEVCEKLSPRIHDLAWRMLRNDADAEDVTQEVLLQVTQRLDTFRGEAEVTTWLHRITVNAVQALRRQRAKQNAYLSKVWLGQLPHRIGPGEHSTPAPDKAAMRQEHGRLLDRAIRNLQHKYRSVYLLSELEGLSNQEIAEILGLSLPAVKTRLRRGRLCLRRALRAYFPELDRPGRLTAQRLNSSCTCPRRASDRTR
jgi:RNA polymerase sigma-70 factor (ECF subfamily)